MSIDIDVNDRTPPTPCQTEGCGHPRYHVCTFGKPDLFHVFIPKYFTTGKKRSPFARFGERSQAHKDAISASQRRRWAVHYAANKERDDKIIDRYNEGDVGMKPIAAEFGISYGTVRAVLMRAADEGRVTINTKGVMPPNNKKIA